MKHLKTKLMASVAMLMVATVMISSASFAWFTISTAPEVKGVNTELATNGNLEMALANVSYDSTNGFTYKVPAASTSNDTGKNITWGNNVDLSKYFTETTSNNKTTADKKLRPVAFSTSRTADSSKGITEATATAPAISSPVFGDDGRMSGVSDLTPTVANVNPDSTDTNRANDGVLVEYKNGDTVWAYRTDYFLRTNQAGTIWLADQAENLGNNVMGGGCFIKDSAGKKPGETGVADYLTNVRVYAVVYPVTAVADDGTATLGTAVYSGNLLKANTFATKLFTATANTSYLVQTYIFWDGENLSNADMATAGQNVKLNIQFEHAASDATSATNDLVPMLETTAPTT